MKKGKKIILAILLFLALAFLSLFIIHRHHEERNRREQEQERERVQNAYIRVNAAFITIRNWGLEGGKAGGFIQIPSLVWLENNHGIIFVLYTRLLFYRHETGVELTYEKMLDYFSQEYEEDGTLRLYNNGKHPDVQAFVEWMWEGGSERWDDAQRYEGQLRYLLFSYYHDNILFERVSTLELSSQMLEALARSMRDPDYVLDLTSLQQAGY